MKKNFWIFTLFITPDIYAFDPTYDVTRGALQNDSALCAYGYNHNCSSQNSNKQSIQNIPVRIPSKYGAIAESLKTNGISSSANADSPEEAVKIAIERCEKIKGNGRCQSRSIIRNGCFAISEGKLGKYYEVFIADSGKRNKVEGMAMNKCRKSGAKECHILMPEECSLPVIPR